MRLFDQFAEAADNTIKITSDDLNLGGAPKTVGANNVETLLFTVYFWAGIIAVVIIIIGGIRYTTSNGDAGQVKSAKDTILYAVVGLIVIIMAAAITQFVIQSVA